MIILSVSDILGRFHPLLVHLPIGMLLLAVLLQWLAGISRFSNLRPALPLVLLLGMISALASCLSGYCLSLAGDYDIDLISRHQWMGILTAIVSVIWYWLEKRQVGNRYLQSTSLAAFALITITGHFGGALTHGEDYLSELFSNPEKPGPALAAIPNVQGAILYKDVVNPIFEARCYSCHGPNKQKAKLRLDNPAAIQKGGEDGAVIVPGKPEESELIKRLLLSMDSKEHMPPRNKSQLTDQEISLLHWWVASGMDFNKKISELPQPETIKPVLAALETGRLAEPIPKAGEWPSDFVAPADSAVLHRLENSGVMVIPVSRTSNYLSVNFISAISIPDSLYRLLDSLRQQVVSIKIDGQALPDAAIAGIARCTQLRKLFLTNGKVSEAGIAMLARLPHLQVLNLAGTPVTLKGLAAFSGNKALKRIFLYQSGVTAADWATLSQSLKGIALDSGNYQVPTLATDTQIVKAPK